MSGGTNFSGKKMSGGPIFPVEKMVLYRTRDKIAVTVLPML